MSSEQGEGGASLPTLVKPVPSDLEKGWTIWADGEEIEADHLVLKNPAFGRLEYGGRVGHEDEVPAYDAWVYFPPGGGGEVTPLHSFTPEGELLLGLLEEDRANLGGPTLCVVGGFDDIGEEIGEEAGLQLEVRSLEGEPFVADRGLFAVEPGEGVEAYILEDPFPFELLSENEDGVYEAASLDADLYFLPWRRAAREVRDGIALASFVQLIAELAEDVEWKRG